MFLYYLYIIVLLIHNKAKLKIFKYFLSIYLHMQYYINFKNKIKLKSIYINAYKQTANIKTEMKISQINVYHFVIFIPRINLMQV